MSHGAIPKKYKPGKWHLIIDLSSPVGSSIYDGISSEWSSISFLAMGIEVDSETLQLRLPSEKLYRLKEQLAEAVSKKCLLKRKLQSLTGLLQHITKVIHPGRPFLYRLYALQNVGSHPDHHVHLNPAARVDITWWFLFIDRWNSLSMAWDLKQCNPDIRNSLLRCLRWLGLWSLWR